MPTRQVVVTFEQIVQRLDVMWLSPGDFTKQMYGNQLTHAVNTHYEDLAQQLGCSIEDISWWFDVPMYRVGNSNESLRVRGFGPWSLEDVVTGAWPSAVVLVGFPLSLPVRV